MQRASKGRAADRLIKTGMWGAVRAKRLLMRNRHLEQLFYEAANRQAFSQAAAHDFMLADGIRNRAYAEAIASHVNEGDVVVDLGTGTGFLACLAARQGARVHGIDHGPVENARLLAAANGITGVEFHQTHSRDFDPGEPVDVIIHDQISGWSGFEERVVENLDDLRRRILRPGGRVLPNRIAVYVEPVEMGSAATVPLIWEHRAEGLDFTVLREVIAEERTYPPPCAFDADAFSQLLTEPRPILEIDLERDGPSALPQMLRGRWTITRSGTQHGFALYFRVGFDEAIGITNAPLSAQTHWRTALLRTAALPRRPGDELGGDIVTDPFYDTAAWRWPLEGG